MRAGVDRGVHRPGAGFGDRVSDQTRRPGPRAPGRRDAHRGQLSSTLFVAVYAGASVPTIAAGLVATRFALTAAVLGLGAFVIALAAGATAISLCATKIRRSR